MIQILGLRDYQTKEGKSGKAEKFFEKGWRAETVGDLFRDIEKHLAKIPEKERFNLYFTVANCFEEKGRKLKEQFIIPFDIDDIDTEKTQNYIDIFCKAIGANENEIGIISSGNGLQFFLELIEPITDPNFFDDSRKYYGAICDDLNRFMKNAGLPGVADVSVWSKARLMRLPETWNIKPKKGKKRASLLQRFMVPKQWELKKIARIPDVNSDDCIASEALKKFPPPDTKGVLEGCEFLKWANAHQEEVTEPQWYAMLSVTALLENGFDLSHNYSKNHPSYDSGECDDKIRQAIDTAGPRTCDKIDKLWGKCHKCPWFNEVKSPILIKTPDYIKTETTGFHNISMDKNGNPKPGKPNYEDMRKFFVKKKPYLTIDSSEIVYTYEDTHWEECFPTYLKNFAQEHFDPIADTTKVNEFSNLVSRTNLIYANWFNDTITNKINFQNGILDTKTMEFTKHGKEYGFRYVLPYDYDVDAICPQFEKFLDEVTDGKEELGKVLLEFAGFSIANHQCKPAKALILIGDGANGKSTFIKVLQGLVGMDNYSALTLQDLKNEANRYQIDGKLFNIAEETPEKSLVDSSLFKNLVSGGEVVIKKLYKQPYRIQSRCKLIMACNKMPHTTDSTGGMFRRLLLVPFTRQFTEGDNADMHIDDKLATELPGILNLVLKHYQGFRDRGNVFTSSEIIKGEIQSYQKSVDSVFTWFEDSCELKAADYGEPLSVLTMYDNFKYWAEKRGQKPDKYIEFGKKVRRFIPQDSFARKIVDGKKQTVVTGVAMDAFEEF